MDKWLDAYSKWPPMNQLLFSSLIVAAVVLVLFLFGLWVIQLFRYIAMTRHGWPGEKDALVERMKGLQLIYPPEVVTKMKALDPLCGLDWKEEARQVAEEQRRQAELQAQLHEEMKKAEKNPQNPCTPGVPAEHTHMGAPKATVAKEVPPL